MKLNYQQLLENVYNYNSENVTIWKFDGFPTLRDFLTHMPLFCDNPTNIFIEDDLDGICNEVWQRLYFQYYRHTVLNDDDITDYLRLFNIVSNIILRIKTSLPHIKKLFKMDKILEDLTDAELDEILKGGSSTTIKNLMVNATTPDDVTSEDVDIVLQHPNEASRTKSENTIFSKSEFLLNVRRYIDIRTNYTDIYEYWIMRYFQNFFYV